MTILELIDNALADVGSDDAMRWTPDPAPVPTSAAARRDMLWRKVWWLVDHGSRRRAWGPWRWRWREDGWRLVWTGIACRNPDCVEA